MMRKNVGRFVVVKMQKWGNSLGIRIPASYAEQLDLQDGSEVELEVGEQEIILRPKRVKPNLEELLSRITPENRHSEFDFGKPEGKEIW